MKKDVLKRIGCIVTILFLLGIPAFYIGKLYYYCTLERNYIKIEKSNTITIWKNYIIFKKYWYPFYPKNNYILVNSTWDNYDMSLSITQDSVLGIWCNYPVEVCGMENFRTIQVFDSKKRDEWSKQYSFSNVTGDRQDSLQLEFDFELWYPCCLSKATCTYKSQDSIITRDFLSK